MGRLESRDEAQNGKGRLALTRLVALLRLVDDVDATTAPNHLIVAMALHERLERISDLHRLNSNRAGTRQKT